VSKQSGAAETQALAVGDVKVAMHMCYGCHPHSW